MCVARSSSSNERGLQTKGQQRQQAYICVVAAVCSHHVCCVLRFDNVVGSSQLTNCLPALLKDAAGARVLESVCSG